LTKPPVARPKSHGWDRPAHCSSAGDPIAIASYLGSPDAFDRAIATFADSYAEQNERDYERLRDAIAAGRVEALPCDGGALPR
jgi:Uncharacterized protein conserved in bacteria (DUF2252)